MRRRTECPETSGPRAACCARPPRPPCGPRTRCGPSRLFLLAGEYDGLCGVSAAARRRDGLEARDGDGLDAVLVGGRREEHALIPRETFAHDDLVVVHRARLDHLLHDAAAVL